MNPDFLQWIFWPFSGWWAFILGPAIMLLLGWIWGKAGQADD